MGDLAFYGGLDNHLETIHVILSYLYKSMSGYLYLPNNFKHIRDQI